jgi:hypothetical protein
MASTSCPHSMPLTYSLTIGVGIRLGRARFTPLDRVNRLKVDPRIDSDQPDCFRVGKYSKVNQSN